MTARDIQPLRELLHRVLVRYLTITPRGFVLEPGQEPLAKVTARIIGYGGARTLYRERRPVCRSLDGVTSIQDSARTCAQCPTRGHCTPQVRLDLIVRTRALRLLLAFSSARSFLEYQADLQRRDRAIDAIEHELTVVPRGSWGEVRFRELA